MTDKAKCAICGEELSENDDMEFIQDGWYDYCGLLALDDTMGVICIACMESLETYGNRLVYNGNFKVSITFDDKLYFYIVESDDYDDEELAGIMEELEEIMKVYSWKSTDGWRGHYESRKKEVNGFIQVIEGWNDAFSGNKYTNRINELPSVLNEVVLVFPRSSNICVVYYDIWARKEDVEFIKRFVLEGKQEDFNFSKGIYIKSLV